MPLDEVALRKPEFVEGVRIVLGDGQEWSFPMPKLRLVPQRDSNGEITAGIKAIPGQDKSLSRVFDILWTLAEEEPDDAWSVRFAAASYLLGLNYTLTDDDLGDLIFLSRDDQESLDRWQFIDNVLRGISPKKEPTPDGSDLPVE